MIQLLCFDHVIQEYKIFVNGNLVGMTTDNNYAVKELSPDTLYVVMVTSSNKEVKGDSASISVTTLPSNSWVVTSPSNNGVITSPLVAEPLGAPRQLSIVTFNATSVTVSWLPGLGAHVSIKALL